MPSRSSVLLALAAAPLAACSHNGLETTPVSRGLDSAMPAAAPYESGRAALARGDIGLAVEQFRRELYTEPGSVRALNGLAIAYDELGRFDVARTVYERALRAAPEAPDTLNNFGRSLLRQGAPEAAMPFLVRAREAAPPGERAVVEANLAEARVAAGAPPNPSSRQPGAAGAGLERVGARTHLLRTGVTAPRRLVAVDLPEPGAPPAAPVPPASAGTPPEAAALRLEVANGAGRNRMAARMRSFLARQDVGWGRLTNAASFDHATTEILYRPGFREQASRVARLLPVALEPRETRAPGPDVRLVLGHDLLPLDSHLQELGSGS